MQHEFYILVHFLWELACLYSTVIITPVQHGCTEQSTLEGSSATCKHSWKPRADAAITRGGVCRVSSAAAPPFRARYSAEANSAPALWGVRKSGAVAVDTWHTPPPVLTVSFAVAVAGTLRSTGHAFRSSQLGKKLITPRERAFFLERLTGGFRSNWCRHNGVIYVKQTGGSPLTQLQLSLLAASSSSE